MNDTDYERYQDQIKNLTKALKDNPLARKWLCAVIASALSKDENDFEVQTQVEKALDELSA